MTKHFLVSLAIDVIEEDINTPEEAAEWFANKLKYRYDPTEMVYDVIDVETNDTYTVDLLEEGEDRTVVNNAYDVPRKND